MCITHKRSLVVRANHPDKHGRKNQDEQVPVAVVKTFESEFGAIKTSIQHGAWYSHFGHTTATPASQGTSGTSRAIPIHYSYKGEKDGKKVEIKFTPEGKLVYAKGLEDKHH